MLKNVFILGDSYSTFEGYVPEGYISYYRPDGPSYLRKKPVLLSYPFSAYDNGVATAAPFVFVCCEMYKIVVK